MSKDFSICGTAVKGDGRGRSLGFPTANLRLDDDKMRPADGVYVCKVRIVPEDQELGATLHVGPRPTFKGTEATVEVHILDFPDKDLYGQRLCLEILDFIRPVQKFASKEELIEELGYDVDKTKELLR